MEFPSKVKKAQVEPLSVLCGLRCAGDMLVLMVVHGEDILGCAEGQRHSENGRTRDEGFQLRPSLPLDA